MACAPTSDIYQLKITLRYQPPPIWRRVLVPKDTTFRDLHFIIIEAMGWNGGHLHQFEPDKYDAMCFEKIDEKKTKLCDRLKSPKDKVKYVYDLGEEWEHTILLEKILLRDPNIKYPGCIAGERASPPESYELIEEMTDDPDHPNWAFNHKDIDLAERVASRAQRSRLLNM